MNTQFFRGLIRSLESRIPIAYQARIAKSPKTASSTIIALFTIGKPFVNITTLWCNPRYSQNKQITPLGVFISAGLLSFLAPKDPEGEDTPEDKLVMTIKRSILCIQREQYAKAEQMLHLALRMAQDLQNKDGVTFIYDVMANLAMETEQYKKAEKLFVNVMQRLLQDGCKEDDIKVSVQSSDSFPILNTPGNRCFTSAPRFHTWKRCRVISIRRSKVFYGR